MCDESDDDELVNAMPFKLKIQIGVGKAPGTPKLGGDNFTWLGLESSADLATPRTVPKEDDTKK